MAEKTTFAGARVLDGTEYVEQGGESDKTLNAAINPNTQNLLTDKGSISFQVGANYNDTIALSLSNGFSMYGIAKEVGFADFIQFNNRKMWYGLIVSANVNANNKNGFTARWFVRWSVSTHTTAQLTLKNIDKFIECVDSKRAELGAIQNRMEATIRNQANISENESDARSRIRDTDFAKETANLTQNNIIQQASQSVLAQANQHPAIATYLLR